MSNIIKTTDTDRTGIKLTPGRPTVCLGNGEQGFECCCDECDYYLLCFPEFDPQKPTLPRDAMLRGARMKSRRSLECNPQLVAVWNHPEGMYGINTKCCMLSSRRQ